MEANLEKGTKVCSRCKRELPLDQFYTSASTKDGYRSQCIECAKQSAKETQRRRRGTLVGGEGVTGKSKAYRKLTLVERKQLLLQMRSDKPLSAYHPRELFEYLASLGYKITAEYTQKLNFG